MQTVEDNLGRVRKERWGPRTIDLDLLIYENILINSPLLELPHPRIVERDFVLIPLAEIAPNLIIPGQTITVRSEERRVGKECRSRSLVQIISRV